MAILSALWSWLPQALLFSLCVFFVAFLGYCLYIKHVHLKYDHIPGPPRKSFLFGHSALVVEKLERDELIHDMFLECAQTYGPVVRYNVLHYVILLVSCPKATKEILMSAKHPKDKYLYTRMANLFGQWFMGNGLATALNHEQWHKQRRIMDPAFSSLYLRGLTGIFNERAEKMMERLSEEADNNTVANMLHLISDLTLDIIAKVGFGVDLDLKYSSPFLKAIETCLKGMSHYIYDATFEYKPQNWPFISEVREACRLLRSTGAQWINERKTAINNGENVPKDLLTQIIKSAEQEENMTKEDEELMVDNFVTFFIAGQETTANEFAFCVMELGRHPDILEKLKKEVDEVIGVKTEISYEDLGNLTYLSQVLKETLRLYPTAPTTSRDVLEDIVIDGHHIPGGVTCMLSSYISSRLEKFFNYPLKFDPDRFHPDAPKPYYCYYPFALGPRSCIGQNFAQIEAKLVIAKLIQRFDFTLVSGQSFDIKESFSLKPKSGVLCKIKHRHTS
ncbi:hypothetical protein WMY93_015734 [Mugilogobius chulae]|uniref:Cholesterol 24-hydroxylase n=1 Tax=Mugilogobius chulae TaxID=88201 RepID=A0AAW0NRZ7_9GOBI